MNSKEYEESDYELDWDLLALSVEHRLCINFYVPRANFLATLHSHLDITCSCCVWSNLFNVNVDYSVIYI